MKSANDVGAELLSAFASVSKPTASELILDRFRDIDRAGQERLRHGVQGKNWQTLDKKYLSENWSAFCYLSAQGYKYYLPSLLKACLDQYDAESDFLHSVVFSLVPSANEIYYEGREECFDEQTSLFDTAQLRAVASFLGLAFTHAPGLRTLAGQALRWGWSRCDHPALVAANVYFHEQRHCIRGPVAQPAGSHLVPLIDSAFADTPYPGDNELCGSGMGDEPAEYALELRGANWRTLHPQFLCRNHACLSFLSDAGFRYFLPAYLINDFVGTGTTAGMSVFHLTYGLTTEAGAERDTRRYRLFTKVERQAIISYLQHWHEESEFDRDSIRQSLDSYWMPSLNADIS